MSKVFSAASAIIMIGAAALSTAQARAVNHDQPRPGHAGWVSSSPSSVGPWEFVPGQGL